MSTFDKIEAKLTNKYGSIESAVKAHKFCDICQDLCDFKTEMTEISNNTYRCMPCDTRYKKYYKLIMDTIDSALTANKTTEIFNTNMSYNNYEIRLTMNQIGLDINAANLHTATLIKSRDDDCLVGLQFNLNQPFKK